MLQARTLANIAIVSVFAAACIGGLAYLAFNVGLGVPGRTLYRVGANFADATGLVSGDEVRVSGVKVGKVVDVGPAADGSTHVTLEIDDSSLRLRQDVRALIRPKTLLGNKMVELVRTPRSSAPLLASGQTIPKAQTGDAVEIDDILNNLDPETRAAMSEDFRQLGVAVDKRAGDVNQELPLLEQTAANLRPLAQLSDRRQQEIGRILTDLNVIITALADEQDSLGRVVDSGDRFFGAVAARDQALASTIEQLDILFQALDRSFAGATQADRAALDKAPATMASTQRVLALTNPEVDRILPELLLGQIAYPSDQLSLTRAESLNLALEWISAFAQKDGNGNSFRVTSIGPTLACVPGAPQCLPNGLPVGTPASAVNFIIGGGR